MKIRKRKQPARQLQEQKNKKWIKRIGERPRNIGVMFRGLSFMLVMFLFMDFFHGRAGSQIEGVAEVRVFPPSAERDEPAFCWESLC